MSYTQPSASCSFFIGLQWVLIVLAMKWLFFQKRHLCSSWIPSVNSLIFQNLDVSLRKMTLQLEELLLLKLLQFFGYVQQDDDITGSNEEQDECLYATQR